LDNTRINAFQSLEPLPYMSKRFLLERFLGLTEEEIQENEEMWREENDTIEEKPVSGQDLRSVGINPAGMEADIETGQDIAGMAPATPGTPGATPGAPMPANPGGAAPGNAPGAPA
jgi:hypothetical protein